MFEIELSPDAIEDIRFFKKSERRHILDEVEVQLKHQPALETRNRKRLNPNKLSEWELRINKFRIFYEVDEQRKIVKIIAAGFKRGNVLYIRGKEFEL